MNADHADKRQALLVGTGGNRDFVAMGRLSHYLRNLCNLRLVSCSSLVNAYPDRVPDHPPPGSLLLDILRILSKSVTLFTSAALAKVSLTRPVMSLLSMSLKCTMRSAMQSDFFLPWKCNLIVYGPVRRGEKCEFREVQRLVPVIGSYFCSFFGLPLAQSPDLIAPCTID